VWPLFSDEKVAALTLLQCGGLDTPTSCPACGGRLRLEIEFMRWRCNYSACRKIQSIRKGSFFSQSKLPLGKILLIGYLWLNRVPTISAICMAEISEHTASGFYGFYRQLVADSLDEIDCRIGGPNIVIEIGESKFGKRKFNRGHRIEGVWVVGGVERTPEKKVFVCRVEQRDAATLRDVISRFVLPGSIVYSDMWKGYANMESELGFEHHTVNHSVEFVSESGVHTNTIEATWCGMKILIPKRNRTKEIDNHLWEYVWRKKNRAQLWSALMQAYTDVSYE